MKVDSANFFRCLVCGNYVEVHSEDGFYSVRCSCGLLFDPRTSSVDELLLFWNRGLLRTNEPHYRASFRDFYKFAVDRFITAFIGFFQRKSVCSCSVGDTYLFRILPDGSILREGDFNRFDEMNPGFVRFRTVSVPAGIVESFPPMGERPRRSAHAQFDLQDG